ncbi:DUF5683 domain-containing protein [Dyadobacter psychrotolerans]|uniref:DUF5683 domain-containing protein n=1 Tax=Dyadobacter psychrotolerans TaxID=2541721 RepID=A0A4R5DK07_9BACT|nr:DUF5683 domain-containing protein [Dyadobacter psychrotolerans]TDE14476.1 hypothetical protein E0F88_14855 [Dyadobacter psychrotolerans]
MKNLLYLLLLIPFCGVCQQTLKQSNLQTSVSAAAGALGPDSVNKQNARKKFSPVPQRATRLALIPGFGQLYNHDYWKLPIVYLSMGGGIYSYYLNNLKYKDFLTAYKTFYEMDKNSKTFGQLKPGITQDSSRLTRVRNLFNTESEYIKLSRDVVERQKNYWRRNRNLSLIVTGLIYSLSIIEANVAAHLKTFDLSDDLTLRVEPKLSQPLLRQATPGVRLVLNL